MSHRTWTEEEVNYLQEQTGVKNFTQIAGHLGRTPGSVRAKAAELKLRNPIEWPSEDVEFLKKNAGKMTYAQIAEKIGKTERAVGMKALKLGIKGTSQPWSEDELEFLQESAGSASLDYIAKKLGRSNAATWAKMVEMGCSDFHMESGTYSAKALSELIGVSSETVRRWIIDKGLPAVKKGRKYKVDKRYMSYHIEIPKFWKWAEQNKDLIEFNKIEPDILPPEPAWVAEERKKQFYSPPKQKIWTTGEDNRLWNLYYSGMKQKEIAAKMNRTENSIERRLSRLRKIRLEGNTAESI